MRLATESRHSDAPRTLPEPITPGSPVCSQQRLAFPSLVSSSHRPLTIPHPARTQGCAHTEPPSSMRHRGGGASGSTPCSGRARQELSALGNSPQVQSTRELQGTTGLLQASLHPQASVVSGKGLPLARMEALACGQLPGHRHKEQAGLDLDKRQEAAPILP